MADRRPSARSCPQRNPRSRLESRDPENGVDRKTSRRTPGEFMKIITSLLCIVAFSHCTTTRERRAGLESDFQLLSLATRKALFAYYPDLTPNEREGVIQGKYNLEELLKEKNLYDKFYVTKNVKRPQFVTDRKNYTPSGIEIVGGPNGKITDGTSLPITAYLVFEDGRRTDVSDEVLWEVEPSAIARYSGRELKYGCAHGDVVVSATLLDQVRGNRKFRFRKQVNEIQVHVARQSQGNSDHDFVSLDAIAECADGSETVVNCQAVWKLQEMNEGLIKGCGHYVRDDIARERRAPSGARHLATPIQVEIMYGETRALQSVMIPPRRY